MRNYAKIRNVTRNVTHIKNDVITIHRGINILITVRWLNQNFVYCHNLPNKISRTFKYLIIILVCVRISTKLLFGLLFMFHSSLFIHKTHVWNWMKRFDTNLSFLLFSSEDSFSFLIPFLAYSSNNNNIVLPQDTLQYQRIDERVVMNHYSHRV